MDIKMAAQDTRILMNRNWVTRPSPTPPSITHSHIEMMLNSITEGKVTGEKAHRWLGWAQCAAVVANAGTLEEMKAINHAA